MLAPLGLLLAAQEPAKLEPYIENLPDSLARIQMVPIPGGKVTVRGREVEVKPFFMARTETTWDAFDVFLASGPASEPYDQTPYAPDAIARPSKSYILPDLGWGHKGYPAINLSHTSAEMFVRWLAKATKKKYRLPTEAEWQIAAQATPLAPATLEQQAWFAANSKDQTHPVGRKVANRLGVYDLLGNVGEWATDLDGKPVLCGGTFQDGADKQNATTRRYWSPAWQERDPQMPKSRWWLSDGPFAGFRVVCEP
jgi:formylglycine-generating enzyme required for sulfatase activity